MKKQIDAFNAALGAFDTYAQMLQDAAVAIRAGDRRDDLIVSLMRSNTDVLPAGIVDKLLEGSAKTAQKGKLLKTTLAKPDVNEAILDVVTANRYLDGLLEPALDMQSPAHARVPPPYMFFKPVKEKLSEAFPHKIGGPLITPEISSFQKYLETVNNPWR